MSDRRGIASELIGLLEADREILNRAIRVEAELARSTAPREVRLRPIGASGGPELLTLLAAADGWCMVREGSAAPFVITAEEWRSLPVDTATATDPFAAAPRTWALRWTVSERADHAQWEAWADSAGRLTLGQRCHREVTARGVRPTWNGMRWSARAVER